MADKEGLIDGYALGWDDGIDVGQTDTEGCLDGWLLGAVLINGE